MKSDVHSAVRAISHKLEKFQQVSPNKWIFRCAVCGDSRKDPNKLRGAIIDFPSHAVYTCFNCGLNTSFTKFLREFDEEVYKEFRLGRLKEDVSFNIAKPKEKNRSAINDLFEKSIFSSLSLLQDLPKDHIAKKYLRERKVLSRLLGLCYFTEDFEKWSVTINPSLPEEDRVSAPGIVFPLIAPDKTEFGYQCRFLDGPIRYRTIMLDQNNVKCFGLDRVDAESDINMTEGIFDAHYLDNHLASLDASLHSTADKICDVYGFDKKRFEGFKVNTR